MPPLTRTRLSSAAAVLATVASGLVVATIAAPAANAAGAFTADDVVVYRAGTGAAALSSAATAGFVDEFSPTGGAVQSVALPTAANGSNKILTTSGSASSEGFLTLSPNGQYLTLAGYNAAPGTASVNGTTSASVSRTVGIIGTNGAVDTTTSVTDAFSGNNVRSAVTVDGTAVWIAGATSGIRYAVKGASTSAGVSDTSSGVTNNFRQVQIAGGQLYASSQSGSTRVAAIGSGTPTTGPQPVNLLPGAINSTASPNNNPYSVAFLRLGTGTTPDTAYVADQGTSSVQKYSLTGGTWNLTGSVAGLSNISGVAANVYNGSVRIYATTPTGLYRFADTSGAGGTLSGSAGAAIATPGTNTAFRGVAFAPGTTINSGTTTPTVGAPTVTVPQTAIASALGDTTATTSTTATVALGTNAGYSLNDLTVTASSNAPGVATTSVSGTAATRTVSLTRVGVGVATITVTVTAPDAQTGSTSFTYGVSANQGDASDRYYAGAGNASAAVDVGNGYMLVGDDESNVIRLYDRANSGLAVASFDFTAQLPRGGTELDLEGAARVGNTIYWMGSMSNNSSGNIAPARSTLFATTVSGSGASTTLSYVGANLNLQTDLVNWDKNNGHGLGANYFGFDNAVNTGISSHTTASFNLEGFEFAKGSTTTAYLAFRAPIVPMSNRTKALLVPVTNVPGLVADATAHGTFGAPIQWDLGGLGIRDIKANADGTYLVIAGTATSANDTFVLYTWDGNAADAPQRGQDLPAAPAGGSAGWEAIVSVPSPLTAGTSTVQLLEDNGETVWYPGLPNSKDGLAVPLQKDLGRTFTYAAPAPVATSTSITVNTNSVTAGDPVTFTATVTGGTGALTDGTVAFATTGGPITGCTARPVQSDGTAVCTTSFADAGSYDVTATYSGTPTSATSTSSAVTVTVAPQVVATTTTLTATGSSVTAGDPVTFTATISGGAGALTAGTVTFSDASGPIAGCTARPVGAGNAAVCTTTYTQAGSYQITAAYSGTTTAGASTSDPFALTVTPVIVATTTTLTVSDATPAIGDDVTYTATVDAASGTPTGTVTFSDGGTTNARCTDVPVGSDGTAQCVVRYGRVGTHQVTAAYSGAGTFAASSSDTVTVTVQPTPVTITADDQTISFGDADPVFTYTVDPAVDLVTAPMCDVVPAHTAVGSYPITCSGAGGGADYTISYAPGTLTVDQAVTNVVISSDPATPVSGQSLDLVATVTTTVTGTVPSGSVAFTVEGAAVPTCTAVAVAVDGSGVARCTIAAGFDAGSVAVTATYSGDASFAGDSSTASVIVDTADTSTTLTADNATLVSGQSVTYTATVGVDAPGVGTPTGSVSFRLVGTGPIAGCGAVALAADGTAQCTVSSGFAAGTASVRAVYSGDTEFGGSTSAALDIPVGKASTTVAVTASANPPVNGQVTTYTATVSPVAPGSGTPTGTAVFTVALGSGTRVNCDGGNTVALSNGRATCVIPDGVLLGGRTYSVGVAYGGDDDFTASNGSLAQTIALAATRVTVTSSPSAVNTGASVTIKAAVSTVTPGGGKPAGTVTFRIRSASGVAIACADGNTVDGAKVPTCVIESAVLAASDGPYSVVVSYSGNSRFTASSSSLTITVGKATTTMVGTQSSTTSAQGKPVTFGAVVTPTRPGPTVLRGTITFVVKDKTGATVACAGGGAITADRTQTCTVAGSALVSANGPYTATVTYSGDPDFTGSRAVVTHKVAPR